MGVDTQARLVLSQIGGFRAALSAALGFSVSRGL